MAVNASIGRAVFLDKDGTLIEDVPYNVDPVRLRLMPGAIEGLRALQAAGFRLIVVTNQSGVARRLFTEPELAVAHAALDELLLAAGVTLDGFYYCPHLPAPELFAWENPCAMIDAKRAMVPTIPMAQYVPDGKPAYRTGNSPTARDQAISAATMNQLTSSRTGNPNSRNRSIRLPNILPP